METSLLRKSQNLRIERRKPEGGYCIVSSHAFLSAWLAYRNEIIELLDLRVWFACLELLARRCGAKNGRQPRYSHAELQTLVGNNSERSVRASLRRLERAGLVRWSSSKVWVAQRTSDMAQLDPSHQTLMADRPVPIPRRMLRYLASVQRPVLIATTVGHLLRGLYLRRGTCVSGGRCKASWIAEVFGVDIRNVKAGRRTLTQNGWLVAANSSQTAMNRWGHAFVINLEWRLKRAPTTSKSPPPRAYDDAQSPPPEKNKKLLIGSGTPKPIRRGGTGACARRRPNNTPSLQNVVLDDLRRPERTAALFDAAVQKGSVRNTSCDRLRIFSAAEHAKRFGTRNACGMFVWLLRERKWSHINQHDEDRACVALRVLEDVLERQRQRGTQAIRNGDGSASSIARHAGPEAARQVIAGTGLSAYSILESVSAGLATRCGWMAPAPESTERDNRHASTDREFLAA